MTFFSSSIYRFSEKDFGKARVRKSEMKIGLRIDVDTFRGTRFGVPHLCSFLADHSIRATFFFSLGPDNMGRHIRRLIRPAFFLKMLRSRAPNIYGWDIILKGTLWQGPLIEKKLAPIIQTASEEGHEIGFHAWDHYYWQAHIDTMNSEIIYQSIHKGVEELRRITGQVPVCSAVPGWKCNDMTLIEKNKFPFKYNSDCRGTSIFYPQVKEKILLQPQIPVTLPTYDEVIGHQGITNNNYNDYLISLIKPNRLNVLTIHAEVEGISCKEMFENFITRATTRGITFVPLGTLLPESHKISKAQIVPGTIKGREGWVAYQRLSK